MAGCRRRALAAALSIVVASSRSLTRVLEASLSYLFEGSAADTVSNGLAVALSGYGKRKRPHAHNAGYADAHYHRGDQNLYERKGAAPSCRRPSLALPPST